LEKPLLDKKAYRTIELSNGLKVLLISDPTAEMGGAGMNIHAGSYQDPQAFQGLAHFHEHMLFLGTDKFPLEDEYELFLSTHGGSSNAFTADEDTNFFFDVASNQLEGALERFAQFFLCPSFSKEMVGREVRAVDSEHRGNVPNDAWRVNQVFCQGLNPAHPASRFSTGNLDTLLHDHCDRGKSEDEGGGDDKENGGKKKEVLDEEEGLKKLHAALVRSNLSNREGYHPMGHRTPWGLMFIVCCYWMVE